MQKVSVSFIVLAAGIGSRMKSSKPKVLHQIVNRTMINFLIEKLVSLKSKILLKQIIVVLGHENKIVRNSIVESFPLVKFVIQKKQLGTADAVLTAKNLIVNKSDKVVVLCGDAPLVSKDLIISLIKNSVNSTLGIVGFYAKNPNGYGRVVMDADNNIEKIVEHKNASNLEKKINLCNSGILISDSNFLMNSIKKIKFDNVKKEKYLTDIVKIARNKNKYLNLVIANEKECIGINDRKDLAMVEREIQEKLRNKFMSKGVTLISPETVFFSYDTKIEADVIIGPNVVFGPKVKIGKDVKIEAFCHLEGVTIRKGSIIGPFARLRPGTIIEQEVKIGNFVEVKKSKIKKGAKVNHLSYIGDAEIGGNSNIGAGVITCNYDGNRKNQTIIKDKAFIGSNVSLVAPVKVGSNGKIGAGSVITKDVPNHTLAVERNKQVNIKNNKKKP